MPKAIFVGFSLAEVRMRGLAHKRLGDRFFVTARGPCGDPSSTPLEGKVVFIREDACGKLLILRNSHRGDLRYHCSGWTYIPIWLGCEWKQNGVIAFWKDTDASSHLEAQRASDDWNEWCQEMRREREVSRAMAL